MEGSQNSSSFMVSMIAYPYLSLPLFLLFYTTYLLSTGWKHIIIKGRQRTIGWTRLPTLCQLGSERKLSVCSGCLLPIDVKSKYHACIFQHRWFSIKQCNYPPCQVRYHVSCIAVAPPLEQDILGKAPGVFNTHLVLPICHSYVNCVQSGLTWDGNWIHIRHQIIFFYGWSVCV